MLKFVTVQGFAVDELSADAFANERRRADRLSELPGVKAVIASGAHAEDEQAG